jgi:hypothetical protein
MGSMRRKMRRARKKSGVTPVWSPFPGADEMFGLLTLPVMHYVRDLIRDFAYEDARARREGDAFVVSVDGEDIARVTLDIRYEDSEGLRSSFGYSVVLLEEES